MAWQIGSSLHRMDAPAVARRRSALTMYTHIYKHILNISQLNICIHVCVCVCVCVRVCVCMYAFSACGGVVRAVGGDVCEREPKRARVVARHIPQIGEALTEKRRREEGENNRQRTLAGCQCHDLARIVGVVRGNGRARLVDKALPCAMGWAQGFS